MGFMNLPRIGSFQRGTFVRSSNPLEAVWRQVERAGTIDRLTALTVEKGHQPSLAREASLKIRQAIELRRAAMDTSVLTKPLLLYYSALNLVRGVALAFAGSAGAPTHGLSYSAGTTLLDCKAKVQQRGTFPTFAQSMGAPAADVAPGKEYTLRDLFAVIPELRTDFGLLNAGESSVVLVRIEAIVNGPTVLRFVISNETESGFQANWQQSFHWLADVCDYEGPFRLRTKVQLEHDALISEFCHRNLMSDLRHREDATWFDHRVTPGVTLLHRLPAYLAALFILSNVSRYEPQLLDEPTAGLTDLGYVLTTFLENAERFVPQLVLELFNGPLFFE
jgi:hypothetical protein